MAANGCLPASDLASIPGTSPRPGGRPVLRKDAAALYNAMAACAGVSMSVHEDAMRRAYREYTAQVYARNYWCRLGKCGNAAVPGTSGHGWGLKLDVENGYQRSWIDNHGRAYGWSKHIGDDAPWEWWHCTCTPSIAWIHPFPWPTIRYGSRGSAVEKCQRLLIGRHKYTVGSPDGVFGRQTYSAVIAFQRRNHLTPDGVVGPATWRVLLRR